MSDAKNVAEKLFSSDRYKRLTIKLSIKNLTANTEVSDARVVRKQLNSSVKIGNAKALELLEFNHEYIVIGSTIQIGALGHQLELKVTVLDDIEDDKKLFAFKSEGKITMFERKKVDDKEVFIMRFNFQKGDQKNWDEINGIFASKQTEITQLFNKMKGIE